MHAAGIRGGACWASTCPSHAGVIWKGDSVIDGVPETLDLLRSLVRMAAYGSSSLI